MIQKELFYKIADNNFQAFAVASEKDIELFYSLYPDKERIRQELLSRIQLDDINNELSDHIIIELYVILIEFSYKNNISLLETCVLFRILSDVLNCFKKNMSKKEVYEQFKKSVLLFSMNRFFYQIGVLKKETVYLITNFFVDVIYRRYYLIKHALNKELNIDLNSKELSVYELPKVESLNEATEILPRREKILRQFFEARKPKTELERKIEEVLEFERERLEKKMDKNFAEQDQAFNAKLDELFKRKK